MVDVTGFWKTKEQSVTLVLIQGARGASGSPETSWQQPYLGSELQYPPRKGGSAGGLFCSLGFWNWQRRAEGEKAKKRLPKSSSHQQPRNFHLKKFSLTLFNLSLFWAGYIEKNAFEFFTLLNAYENVYYVSGTTDRGMVIYNFLHTLGTRVNWQTEVRICSFGVICSWMSLSESWCKLLPEDCCMGLGWSYERVLFVLG